MLSQFGAGRTVGGYALGYARNLHFFSSWDEGSYTTEPEEAALPRRHVGVAICCPNQGRRAVPRPAAHNSAESGEGSNRIHRRRGSKILLVMVMTPLMHVSRHVMQAPDVGALLAPWVGTRTLISACTREVAAARVMDLGVVCIPSNLVRVGVCAGAVGDAATVKGRARSRPV